jgi:putative ABC transport system substrate-binding protein
MIPKHKFASPLFCEACGELGWTERRNLQIDYRWGMGDIDRHRKNAEELVALAPDVILVHGSTIMSPLQRVTRTVPIVFVSVADSVAGGFVASLARPGGNATGFTSADYSISGKWLELLKQMATQCDPGRRHSGSPQFSAGDQLGAIQAVAPLFGMEVRPIGVRDAEAIESDIREFAHQPNGGLIVTTSALAQIYRELIITLAARHRLPAIYPYRLFVTSGGLMSYEPSVVDQYWRAASYVDRILKDEKPADLPVQQPSKIDLVVNPKTTEALGLALPQTLLARAEKVID